MPPKKKNAKGGKKKDSGESKDKESLLLAQSEIANLQQHIEIQKQDLLQAKHMERMWRQRCEENQEQFAREKQNLLDIAQDMARKSTVQSDQKQTTIEVCQARIKDLESEKGLLQSQLEALESKGAAAADEHEQEAKDLRLRIQCMHSEFSKLLSHTLCTFKKDLLAPYIADLSVNSEGEIAMQTQPVTIPASQLM